MKDYILYLKTCPGVESPRHFKIGIASLTKARTRLAAYQNAVGPVWEEKFIRVWIGDENHIREAEKQFKRNFKDRIQSAEAGMSEWISDVTIEELINFSEELKNDYYIKFQNVPNEFEPLTMPLCEQLQEWYEQEKDNLCPNT